MNVQVPWYKERAAGIGEKSVRGDRMKPTVRRVNRVGVDQAEGVELAAKKGFLRGYVEGHNVDLPCEPWQH